MTRLLDGAGLRTHTWYTLDAFEEDAHLIARAGFVQRFVEHFNPIDFGLNGVLETDKFHVSGLALAFRESRAGARCRGRELSGRSHGQEGTAR